MATIVLRNVRPHWMGPKNWWAISQGYTRTIVWGDAVENFEFISPVITFFEDLSVEEGLRLTGAFLAGGTILFFKLRTEREKLRTEREKGEILKEELRYAQGQKQTLDKEGIINSLIKERTEAERMLQRRSDQKTEIEDELAALRSAKTKNPHETERLKNEIKGLQQKKSALENETDTIPGEIQRLEKRNGNLVGLIKRTQGFIDSKTREILDIN